MAENCAQILAQSLDKKNQILDKIIEQNRIQENLLKQDELNMDAFEKSIDVQNGFLQELDKLDEGFETLYDRFREELVDNKEKYSDEIRRMQELITQITDKIVKIKADNMRNKMMAENQFKRKRKEIQTNVSKSKVARNYYNSMNNLNQVAPQFYDNKK